jgi:hypothetical protein
LLGPIPETTRLIYERQCYKNAETVVRGKLQLLQQAIAGTIKALNDAGASRTLPPAEGGEQDAPGAPAPARDVAVVLSAAASARCSEAPGNAGDRRDDQSPKSGSRLSGNLSAQGEDAPKSSSPDAAVSERTHREKTRGTQTPNTQTPNMSAQGKPVTASAKGAACQTSRSAGQGPWAWRLIDGRQCWYEGAAGMDKSLLHWPPR